MDIQQRMNRIQAQASVVKTLIGLEVKQARQETYPSKAQTQREIDLQKDKFERVKKS